MSAQAKYPFPHAASKNATAAAPSNEDWWPTIETGHSAPTRVGGRGLCHQRCTVKISTRLCGSLDQGDEPGSI